MTDREKEAITRFRENGRSYQEIADNLNINKDAVRSFCRTHHIAPKMDIKNRPEKVCQACGKIIHDKPGRGRKRRFCSDKCRSIWWSIHPEAMEHSLEKIHIYKCAYCGKAFRGYTNVKRKYCSNDCANQARFGAVDSSR